LGLPLAYWKVVAILPVVLGSGRSTGGV